MTRRRAVPQRVPSFGRSSNLNRSCRSTDDDLIVPLSTCAASLAGDPDAPFGKALLFVSRLGFFGEVRKNVSQRHIAAVLIDRQFEDVAGLKRHSGHL